MSRTNTERALEVQKNGKEVASPCEICEAGGKKCIIWGDAPNPNDRHKCSTCIRRNRGCSHDQRQKIGRKVSKSCYFALEVPEAKLTK